MMKRIFIAVLLMVLCIGMTSCDSENVKKAKDAYEAEKYAEVVNALENEKDLDDDVVEMQNISKARL